MIPSKGRRRRVVGGKKKELRSSPHILILEKLLLPPAGSSLVLGWRDEFIAYTKNWRQMDPEGGHIYRML
ncbi:hypothetical protein HGM15179_000553 [Zosterops borbonicus]|uniref:Uncharacterized protein n=1 Tax=Zosterops borbonicus TaxID=364589 RepID=A0A8K1GW85_9PASS|nr:hypothetical protein HGM15179_000553 [Zosterops borbonicus]